MFPTCQDVGCLAALLAAVGALPQLGSSSKGLKRQEQKKNQVEVRKPESDSGS